MLELIFTILLFLALVPLATTGAGMVVDFFAGIVTSAKAFYEGFAEDTEEMEFDIDAAEDEIDLEAQPA